MQIIVGKYSGFCKGVSITYQKALEELKKGPIYCLGKIIHNELVTESLEKMKMITINSIKEVDNNSRVIFRAHGEPKKTYDYAKEHNIEIVDLTCPKVKLIHEKVSSEKDNSFIIIIGKKEHPEIIGTSGFAKDYIIVETEEDLKEIEKIVKNSEKRKIYSISQTTFSSKKFDIFVEKITKNLNSYEIKIDKSICNATEKRQEECEEISKKASTMIVIGSKNSSNTRELYDISNKNCQNVYFVEKVEDLNNLKYNENDIIGIVAGASTPKFLIDEIVENIVKKGK